MLQLKNKATGEIVDMEKEKLIIIIDKYGNLKVFDKSMVMIDGFWYDNIDVSDQYEIVTGTRSREEIEERLKLYTSDAWKEDYRNGCIRTLKWMLGDE